LWDAAVVSTAHTQIIRAAANSSLGNAAGMRPRTIFLSLKWWAPSIIQGCKIRVNVNNTERLLQITFAHKKQFENLISLSCAKLLVDKISNNKSDFIIICKYLIYLRLNDNKKKKNHR
jgi:hypothetical protein